MAVCGEWTGATVIEVPGTSWGNAFNLFPTEVRNDGGAYSLNTEFSRLTLPSTNLADGYLIIGSYEFEDTSNGRHNPAGRLELFSGTGNFQSGRASGYSRDNSENRAYVLSWGFIDNPSPGAVIQFLWRRDSDPPTGNVTRSNLKVIPLYYSNVGVYGSTSTAQPGGTTPTQLTGFSAVTESDAAAIEIASDTVTVKGDNKRYLCLGSFFFADGSGNTRTQRWGGLRIDGALDNAARGYAYMRNNSNDLAGEVFTQLIETGTADRTVDIAVFRGEALGTFPQTGADVDGATTAAFADHALVVLELHDDAEVFSSVSNTQTDIRAAGVRVDLNIAETVNFNDAASFTKVDNANINVEQACDVLFGANISGGYAADSTARYTGFAELTVNGAGQSNNFAGDYGRGNQGTIDTWGWSANLIGFQAVAANDNVGVNAGKLAGGEGGPVDALANWHGLWGVNLDTMQPAAGSNTVAPGAGSIITTGYAPSIGRTNSQAVLPGVGGVSLTGNQPVIAQQLNVTVEPGAGAISVAGSAPLIAQTFNQVVAAAPGALLVSGYAPQIAQTRNQSVEPGAAAINLAGSAPSIDQTFNHFVLAGAATVNVSGSIPTIEQTANNLISAQAGSVILSGNVAEVIATANQVIEPLAGSVTVTGGQPSIAQGNSLVIGPGAGSVSVTGYAPSIVRADSRVIEPAPGSVIVTGHAPQIDRQDSQVVEPIAGSVAVTGYAPAIAQANDNIVRPGSGAMMATGYTPAVQRTQNTWVAPGSAQVIINGYQANVAQTGEQTVAPGPGVLVWSGGRPIVTNTPDEPGEAHLYDRLQMAIRIGLGR